MLTTSPTPGLPNSSEMIPSTPPGAVPWMIERICSSMSFSPSGSSLIDAQSSTHSTRLALEPLVTVRLYVKKSATSDLGSYDASNPVKPESSMTERSWPHSVSDNVNSFSPRRFEDRVTEPSGSISSVSSRPANPPDLCHVMPVIGGVGFKTNKYNQETAAIDTTRRAINIHLRSIPRYPKFFSFNLDKRSIINLEHPHKGKLVPNACEQRVKIIA